MDPNAVVLEISSDEENGWGDHTDTIINTIDDYNWIADILDEVNRDDCRYDDSDDVVVISEVLPKKRRRKLASNYTSFDDDCVILDHDPDKPPETRNHNPKDPDDDDDDDDIVVVSEKGQVACRDYPHPRHLCIKFPFASTPNQSHCDQCYCYVCDSLAPCIYWGNGSGSVDHCLASDKSEFWKLERKNSKNVGKDVSEVSVPPMNPPVHQLPSMAQNQTVMSNPIRACPVTPSFAVPNVTSRDRSSFLVSRNKYQPGLVSQQLTQTSYNLVTPVQRPAFKRTASDGFTPAANRFGYNSFYRGSYRSNITGASQTNVNTSVPFSPSSNAPFDFQGNFQPLLNSDPFQPNPVPLSSQAQGKASVPDYGFTSEASWQESQRSTADPKFFNRTSWPQNHPVAEPSSLLDDVGMNNEPSLATASSGSGGLVDYEYYNNSWTFNNPPCAAGSGPFGLSKLSEDRGYMDSGTVFDF